MQGPFEGRKGKRCPLSGTRCGSKILLGQNNEAIVALPIVHSLCIYLSMYMPFRIHCFYASVHAAIYQTDSEDVIHEDWLEVVSNGIAKMRKKCL